MNNLMGILRNLFFWAVYISIPLVCFLLGKMTRSDFSYPVLIGAGTGMFAAAHILLILNAERMKNQILVMVIFLLSSTAFVIRQPLLSDDIERYVWEGYVQTKGLNPFQIAPNDPRFANETLNRKVNHPHMPAVYPPFVQVVFRTLAYLTPSIYSFKLFFFIISAGFVLFLYRKKKYFHNSYYLAGVLPFLAIETSWSGHLDVLGILFLTLSAWFLMASKTSQKPVNSNIFSGLFLGLSVMTKIVPVIFFPLYFKTYRTFRLRAAFSLAFFLPFLLYIPYIDAGWALIFSLKKFSTEWVFSGFFYTLLKTLGADGPGLRLGAGLAFAGIYGWLLFRVKEPLENIFLTFLALMILSPVVHPWYLLWLIPFGGRKYFYSTSVILLISFGMYEVLGDWFEKGIWAESPGMVITGYLVFLAVFVYESRDTNLLSFKIIDKREV